MKEVAVFIIADTGVRVNSGVHPSGVQPVQALAGDIFCLYDAAVVAGCHVMLG